MHGTTGLPSGGQCAIALDERVAPALCGLAIECVRVIERAELTTGLARLMCAGCETLAALLAPRLQQGACDESADFAWVDETLEDLSGQLDFLSLEVYRGLGRLEGAVVESDELPIVLDPDLDHFESYWGSIEHRQALQELSAWLLCVVFRAVGYGAVTSRILLEFANRDPFCLCALLGGLLSAKPGNGCLPHDAHELQSVALGALCGLTAPELAFPPGALLEEGRSIEEQNSAFAAYLKVLYAATVDTGLIGVAIKAALRDAHGGASGSPRCAAQVLAFVAALVLQAEAPSGADATQGDWLQQRWRLRDEVFRRVDALGSLLHTILDSVEQVAAERRELVANCAVLAAGLAAHAQEREAEVYEQDGFTLACRALLAACLGDGFSADISTAPFLASLVALAANVGDLEMYHAHLAQRIQQLRPEERAWARARLAAKADGGVRLPIHGASQALACTLFDGPPSSTALLPPAAPVKPPTAPPTPPEAAAGAAVTAAGRQPGLRDLVQNAPKEFRCALDGKLLCDPVVSPAGVVFERSTLARWLQKHGPQCPITGTALAIEDCHRSAEIRKSTAQWVRGNGRLREPRRTAKD